jgi:hypothetical protein
LYICFHPGWSGAEIKFAVHGDLEFSAGNTKTHSLSSKILPFRRKTITKMGTKVLVLVVKK